MSIINDALKKVQQSLQHSRPSRHGGPDPSSPPEAGPQNTEMMDQLSNLTPTGPKSAFSFFKEWRDTAILLMCFAICIILFFLILYLFRQNPTVPPPKTAPASTAVQKRPEPPPVSAVPDQDGIIVTGVMKMGSENMALINNEIYEVGEMIDGARIITIEMDRVEIMKDGNIQVLRVHGK